MWTVFQFQKWYVRMETNELHFKLFNIWDSYIAKEFRTDVLLEKCLSFTPVTIYMSRTIWCRWRERGRVVRCWVPSESKLYIFLFFLFPSVGIMGCEWFQNANRVLNDTKGRVTFLFLFRKTKTRRTFFLFVVTFETLYLENFLELGICSNEKNVFQHRGI